MWDFSWLERRWPGAGYENWDRALDELQERGYNAVRIDAYPHLVARDPQRTWELVSDSTWTVWDWGSPGRIGVKLQPALTDFIHCCRQRKIEVGLSTWFRQDVDNVRLQLTTPQAVADCWLKTLHALSEAGLGDELLYVDLCNEFPGNKWAPFFDNSPHSAWDGTTDRAVEWMRAAIAAFRSARPATPCTISFAGWDQQQRIDWSFLDLLEPHIWMAQSSDFYEHVGYRYQGTDTSGLEALARKARSLYREKAQHWNECLIARIHAWAETSRRCHRPLMTTECWGPVDYKDWPGLEWDWVKELCELGVREALASQRWIALATSNFCGPQFRGMWRDVAWHQWLTQQIRTGALAWKTSPPAKR